jgi:hypothetical protein
VTEREMEDLLAAYPQDFFPRHSLILKGRQQSFAGVGRFDLLFEDTFQTNILMELKARAAKYEDATQVARYRDALEQRGEKNVLMWLVAPHVPKSVCEFLDRIGIQYSEIHTSEFRNVAQRHGIQLETGAEASEAEVLPTLRVKPSRGLNTIVVGNPRVETGPRVNAPASIRWGASGRDLILRNPEAFDQRRFSQLVDAFEQSVPSGKNAHLIADLRNWAANPRLRWPLGSCSSLLRWTTTSGWKEAVPHAEAIWTYLFGRPVPTWYVWDQGRRKYHLDSQGWSRWFESLPH